ncbi:hypothetical protein ACTFR8_22925 [Bacillus cereus group sp. MYBK15-3]|uniref:hypothetical protein n=1 Tax=Bacillus cereus group TaxID=86661 RepID=UPI001C8C8344|nr:hypothetical protein [Bacillus cereus]MBX9158452.1 hypothetical protein [Bacillus cereus]
MQAVERLVEITKLNVDWDVLHVVHKNWELSSGEMPICYTGKYKTSDELATFDELVKYDEGFRGSAVKSYVMLKDGLYTYERDGDGGNWVKWILVDRI